MNKDKEIQIIKDCLKGTQSAFKALYDLYQGYVYTICVRYGVSPIETKDVMQTIFMEIFKSLNNFDEGKSKFKTWLSRVTINQILTHKKKSKINFSSLEDENINLIKSDFTIPVESLIEEKKIFEILNGMPDKFSVVFNLFIIDGYTHAEIAHELNITKGASRILLHRGRVWAMNELKVVFKDSVDTFKNAINK